MGKGLCNNKKLQYTKRKGVQSMGVEINMDATLDRLFAGFKKLSPLLVGIGVTTGLILFLPKNILAKMALDNIPDKIKMIIGIVFIVSIAVIVSIIFFQLFSCVGNALKKRRWLAQKKLLYLRLSPEQRGILIELLHSDGMTEWFDPTAGIINHLESNDFIAKTQPAMFFGIGGAAPVAYAPQAWLIDWYNEEPQMFT